MNTPKRSAFASKKVRVASVLRSQLDGEEARGVLEALEVGLPVLRDRHGFTSNEARATERAIRLLKNREK